MAKRPIKKMKRLIKAASFAGDAPIGGKLEHRLEYISALLGGREKAANAAGVHPTQLRRYVTGENEIPVRVAVALAKKGRVSLDWLLLGVASQEDKPPLDEALMRDVIRYTENALAEDKKRLAPEKKAELVVLIYRLLADKPTEMRGTLANAEQLRSLIRLAG